MGSIKVHNAKMTVGRIMGKWNDTCQEKWADVIASDCNQYVRMQSGALASSMRIEGSGKKITWNTPYAKRVYYTGKPLKNRNPQASLKWCEKAKGMHMDEWQAAAQALADGI